MATESSQNPPASSPRTAALAGATGLVGSRCLRRLLASSAFEQVVAVVRRPLDLESAKLDVQVGDDLRKLPERPSPALQAALCALGTTRAKAGSKEGFFAVDHDAVVAFARWARQGGATTFVLVSARGASATSPIFYLKVKGKDEESVARLGFARLVILRPGFLKGERQESRPAERLFSRLLGAAEPLLRGPLRGFRPIAADDVAAAMVAAALPSEPGQFIWDDDRIRAAAGELPGDAETSPSVAAPVT
jgi:uncharacterized protein YbjT (DUF2867 family)